MYQSEYSSGSSRYHHYDSSIEKIAPQQAVIDQQRPYEPRIHNHRSRATLEKVIAIPATSAELGSPFLRAYAPALNEFGITQDIFLDFLDHLNRVAVASPPMQVLGLAGNIVGMVPLHTAQIVGGAVNAAATLTTITMSKGRVEMLLRQANQDVFGPRGLCARIAKLEAVAQLSNMPILDEEGNLDKNSSILLPLENIEDSHSVNAQHRRIEALSPWLSPLQIEALPVVQPPSNVFSKMHASVSERQRSKEERKLQKDRSKMHKDWLKDTEKAREDYEKEMLKLHEEEGKARFGNSKRAEKKLAKIEHEREKVEREYRKEMEKVEKDRKKDDKEEKLMRKILFLVVQQVNPT